MTIQNAVRALAKHGDVEHYGGNAEKWNGFWFVRIGSAIVEVFSCGPGPEREAVIGIRGACGTTYFPSLRSALQCALREKPENYEQKEY